jgi:hypothetical protein
MKIRTNWRVHASLPENLKYALCLSSDIAGMTVQSQLTYWEAVDLAIAIQHVLVEAEKERLYEDQYYAGSH